MTTCGFFRTMTSGDEPNPSFGDFRVATSPSDRQPQARLPLGVCVFSSPSPPLFPLVFDIMKSAVIQLGRYSGPRPSIFRSSLQRFCPSRPPYSHSPRQYQLLRIVPPSKAYSTPSNGTSRARFWRSPPTKTGIFLLAALSPLAFVELSESQQPASNGDDDSLDDITSEERMLAVSRAEIAKVVPSNLHGFARARRKVWLFLDNYVVEPVATGLRFLHLALIFVPVIFTIPVIWIGSRVKERDSERTGTLWWYGFLIGSLERGGPAFIKVGYSPPSMSPILG